MVRRRPQAAGANQHDGDHGQGNQQLAKNGGIQAPVGHGLQGTGHIAQYLRQCRQHDRAQNDTRQMTYAAQHHHGHNHHGLHQAE